MSRNHIIDSLTFSVICITWLSLSQFDNLILKTVISIVIVIHLLENFRNNSPSTLPNVFIFGLMIRFFNQSYSSFDELLTTDAALDYLMVNILLSERELLVIDHIIYDERVSFYSSWPLLHYLLATFHELTGSNSLELSINIAQIGIYFGSFMALSAIVNWFKENSTIPISNIPVCIFIAISIPELVYWQSEVVRQSLGVFFHFFFILGILHIFNGQNKLTMTFLVIISTIGLSFAHHLTSAVSLVSFSASLALGVFIVFFFSSTDFDRNQRESLRDSVNLIVIFAIMIILWWAVIGEVLFPTIRGAVNRYYLIITGVLQYVNDPRISVPDELSPLWVEISLASRDFIIYVGTAIGFVLMAYRDQSRIQNFNNLLFYSLVFGYVAASFFLLFFGEFSRVLVFASPFMAVSWCYLAVPTDKEHDSKWLHSGILIILIVSFVSPYNHTFANVYYYDDSISANEAGRPSSGYSEATDFAMEHSPSSFEIGTDLVEFALMSANSPEEVFRFQSLILSISKNSSGVHYNDTKDIVLLIRDGGLFQYNVRSEFRLNLNDLDIAKSEINHSLQENRSKIYDSSEGIGVWI